MQTSQLRMFAFGKQDLLSHYVEAFIASRRAIGRSNSTLRFYQGTLGKLAEFCPGWPPTARDIEGFLDYKRDTVSPTTVETYYHSLSAFLNWCEKRGFLHDNALRSIDKPSKPRRLPKAASPRVIKQLFQAISSAAGVSNETAIRDLAIFRLTYDTGCRASEVGRLLFEDLECDLNAVIVRGGKGSADRCVYFGDTTANALKRWLAVRPDCRWLFPSRLRKMMQPLTRKGVYQALRKWSKLADVSLTVHQLRHSYATHALRNGIDIEHVQHQLGHTTLSTTAIYLAADNAGRRLAHLERSPGDRL